MPDLRDLLDPLAARLAPLLSRPPAMLGGVSPAARAIAVALAARAAGGPMLCVTASRAEAEQLARALDVFLGPPAPLRSVDQIRAAPYGRLYPDRETSIFDEGLTDPDRLQAVHDLSTGQPVVVVAPLLAVLQPVAEVEAMRPLIARVGDATDPDAACARLERMGYRRVAVARVPGDVARHGGVLDVYPANGHPLRAYLADGRIAVLRAFDPDDQRTTTDVESAALLPVREPEGRGDLLDRLPDLVNVLLIEPEAIRARMVRMHEGRARAGDERYSSYKDVALLAEDDPWGAWLARLDGSITITESATETALDTGEVERFAGRLRELVTHLQETPKAWIVTRQPRRLRALLTRRGLSHVDVVEGDLPHGLRIEDAEIFADREVFGHAAGPSAGARIDDLAPDLHEGDIVVHAERGIARYDGLVTVEVEGAPRDLLHLTFADDDRLMVPVSQIDQVSRYLADEDKPPRLSRLGKPEWQKTVARVRASLERAAAHLLEDTDRRHELTARPLRKRSTREDELDESFPYDETPDQQAAVASIRADLEREVPMERLLCGDVGYGKTEIAVRAAFKATENGAQVAVLVPTTVLAQQHEATFRERLAPFGVRVEALTSGMSGEADRVARLREGDIDVVVGTQRLLADDVAMPRLGLVVVDEEQQFGLADKERLRALSTGVHVLTMTATPIPRTMQLSLAGVRDVSVLETPPEARRPVRTYLLEDTPAVSRAAVQRELERQGQVFVLHNRIQSLGRLAAGLRRALPGARVAVAHGQMADRELQQVLAQFRAGDHDVLVCTTIIESGVDMPDVNAILVKDAHTLGLGQLYQIRGRVGRSDSQAYCYLLHPAGQRLTQKARARLETLREMTELGAGRAIALRDLEIRGAGDLLGEAQAGHVGRVGFHLYCALLDEALAHARGETPDAETEDPVPIPSGAYIPQTYVADAAQRVAIYRRLSEIRTRASREALVDELRDRYGPLPAPLQMLVETSPSGS